jgi:hypothetical protein
MTFDMQIDPASLIDPRIALLAVVSYLGCLVLLWLARIFPRLAGRVDDANAVQATHIGLTPRIGGVAIFGALALSVPFAPPEMLQNYTEIIFATTILFLVGLREDLGYPVSPRNRLLTVVGVSLLVIVLIGEWLPRMGLPYVDTALQYWMFGIPFTLLITAGVANGFNLIDRCHFWHGDCGNCLSVRLHFGRCSRAHDGSGRVWLLCRQLPIRFDLFGRCRRLHGRVRLELVWYCDLDQYS